LTGSSPIRTSSAAASCGHGQGGRRGHRPSPPASFTPDAVTDRYLWVGQMIAYKRPDIVVDAFNH
jgi:hypothetical protein